MIRYPNKREIDKTDKNDKTNLYGLPSLYYLTKVLIKNNYIDDFCLDIPKFNSLFEELCRAYDLIMCVLRQIT